VVCEVELGIPTLDALRGKDLESAIRSAYTRGGARHVAERLADGRLPWRNTSIEQRCIRVALAEQIPEMETTLILDPDDDASEVFLGWRWPQSPIATSLQLLYVRDRKRVGDCVKSRDPRRRAVNLFLPSAKELRGFQIYFSLQAEIEGLSIRTQSRVVHSTRA
jgi:hypothetical protein